MKKINNSDIKFIFKFNKKYHKINTNKLILLSKKYINNSSLPNY